MRANFDKSIYVMRFRKPWLRVKLGNFDFSAKLSSTDYNESNKPTPKSLAHIGSEKSLVELGVPKSEICIASKKVLNKSCSKLNFVPKSLRAHMSISPPPRMELGV